MIGRATKLLVRVIGGALAAAPDARFVNAEPVAFMLAAMLGGSVRAVMEGDASEESLACLRRELPRACRAYVMAANGGKPA